VRIAEARREEAGAIAEVLEEDVEVEVVEEEEDEEEISEVGVAAITEEVDEDEEVDEGDESERETEAKTEAGEEEEEDKDDEDEDDDDDDDEEATADEGRVNDVERPDNLVEIFDNREVIESEREGEGCTGSVEVGCDRRELEEPKERLEDEEGEERGKIGATVDGGEVKEGNEGKEEETGVED
jgi:hypothetical protein